MEQLKKEYEKSSDKIQFLTELIQEVNGEYYYRNEYDEVCVESAENLFSYSDYQIENELLENADEILEAYAEYKKDRC